MNGLDELVAARYIPFRLLHTGHKGGRRIQCISSGQSANSQIMDLGFTFSRRQLAQANSAIGHDRGIRGAVMALMLCYGRLGLRGQSEMLRAGVM